MNSIIIFGPKGIGKTKHKEALLKYYKCKRVLDEWAPGKPLPLNDHLVITNWPIDRKVYSGRGIKVFEIDEHIIKYITGESNDT